MWNRLWAEAFLLYCICGNVCSITCYKCQSSNNSQPSCHDPFHPAYGDLEENCMQGKKNRIGLFPAKYCTKVTASRMSDGNQIAVRSCAVNSFDNVCGVFRLDGIEYNGCLMSCTEDACNAATSFVSTLALWTSLVVMYQRMY